MRINEHTAVSSAKVLLVPYSAHHVPKYHEWMRDPEIQAATASEPLTLEEEYAMQRSWRVDADKLTFIICRPEDHPTQTRDGRLDPDSMIGDVNLFISIAEHDAQNQMVVGELELMIAERTEQRKGYGRAAVLTFLNYIVRHEGPLLAEFESGQSIGELSRFNYFAVKVGETNHRSIALFESLGFRKASPVPSYFGEYELRLGRDEAPAFLEAYREIEYSCP